MDLSEVKALEPGAATPLGVQALERLASSWLGALAAEAPEPPPVHLDHLAHAALARLTQGMSQASAAAAWQDWALHLALSPSKQLQLTEKAWRKWNRLLLYAARAGQQGCSACIEPLPQDKRFDDPAWQRWPFNLIHQAFLLQQQWWWNATTGVTGVSRHHEEMVTFAARQWLDMLSPSNFLFTNLVVQAATREQMGANLVRGAINALEDVQRRASNAAPWGAEAFTIGDNIAATPGAGAEPMDDAPGRYVRMR
jgi:polyhydroxyalkanoate synthase subunit PhaC